MQYKDLLGGNDVASMFHYAQPPISLAEVSVDELEELRSKFYRSYIFRPRFVLRHAWRYAAFYALNPDIFFVLAGIRKLFWSSKKTDEGSLAPVPGAGRTQPE